MYVECIHINAFSTSSSSFFCFLAVCVTLDKIKEKIRKDKKEKRNEVEILWASQTLATSLL